MSEQPVDKEAEMHYEEPAGGAGHAAEQGDPGAAAGDDTAPSPSGGGAVEGAARGEAHPQGAPVTAAQPQPGAGASGDPDTLAERPEEYDEDWLDEAPELPRRPRSRLLTPLPLALLGVLLIACGFIGGVLVEKGQTSTPSSGSGAASGFAARIAALRAGGSGASGSSSPTGAAAPGGSFTRPTTGTVAYISGDTLYVTEAEGNTVKVTTSPATAVTKTVKADVGGIHPGEEVAVTGSTGSDGAVSAEAIRVGAATGGGLASLFGGSASSRGGSATGGSTSGSSTNSEPALFGSGGK